MDSRLWTGALLVAAVLALFHPVLAFDFVHYDDFDFVIQNSLLRMSWPDALRASLDPIHKNWIPLTWLSYRLDYAFFQIQPAGYHATNVLLHAVASLILYLTLFRVTGANGRSAFVAACFAVHPLHIESVAWVAERKDTLVGLFWMITVWCYVRHREQPQSVARYGLVLAGLTLALLAKPVAVTLPFALLLLDYWPLARLSDPESAGWPRLHLVGKAVLEKLPLFALVGAASAMTYSAQGAVMDELGELGLGWKLANAAHSYGLYAFDAIWPMNLVVFYPHPMEAISLWQTGVASLFLLGMTLALGRLAASHPYAIVGWLWFLGTLVPMLGLVQVGTQSRADRYMYIPLVGLSILVAWGAVDVAKRMRIPEMALKAIAALAILLLGVTAWFQLGAWRDTESLYLHALDASEGNYLAHKGLANEFLRLGRVEQAEFHYQAAIQLRPEWQSPRLGLIDLTMMQGRSVDALRMLSVELRRTPDNSDVYGRYGLLLGEVGHYAEARSYLARAVKAKPGVPELRLAMSQIEARLGDLRAAIEQGREAMRLAPDYLEAANNLAWLLATAADRQLREPAEAIRLVEAAALESSDPDMLDTLAAAYAAAGRFQEANATALRAAGRADESGAPTLAGDFRERAALYRAGKPYVEPVSSAASPIQR